MSRNSFFLRVLTSPILVLVSPTAGAMGFDTGGGHAVAGLTGIGLVMAIQLGLVLALKDLERRIPLAIVLGVWAIQLGFILLIYPIAFFYYQQVLLGFVGFSLVLWLSLKLPASRVKLWTSLGIAIVAWLNSIWLALWLVPKIGIGESHPIESDVNDWRVWIVAIVGHGLAIGYCLYRALTCLRRRVA